MLVNLSFEKHFNTARRKKFILRGRMNHAQQGNMGLYFTAKFYGANYVLNAWLKNHFLVTASKYSAPRFFQKERGIQKDLETEKDSYNFSPRNYCV
jgi:hypothetical protein